MSMFERYLSEEFDDNYDDCLKDMKDKLAVKKKGTGEILYYIYGAYVAAAVAERYCISLEKQHQLLSDYLRWLVKNKKKFTIIDNKYFCCSWQDVKAMKKKIIDMPNKIFINGGSNV